MFTTREQSRDRTSGGFTLLELVLVMMVIAMIVALAAPSLRGFLGGSRSRDAASQIISLAQWAKARAAADSKVYRLNVDGRSYWLTVQEGEQFVAVGSDFGRRFVLPDGMTVSLVPGNTSLMKLDAATAFDASGIAFYADGRTDTGLVRLAEPDGNVTLFAALSPVDSFRVVTPEEAARL
jgi:prepilin-type N-terminal cleavage/methylation domain-containing protein